MLCNKTRNRRRRYRQHGRTAAGAARAPGSSLRKRRRRAYCIEDVANVEFFWVVGIVRMRQAGGGARPGRHARGVLNAVRRAGKGTRIPRPPPPMICASISWCDTTHRQVLVCQMANSIPKHWAFWSQNAKRHPWGLAKQLQVQMGALACKYFSWNKSRHVELKTPTNTASTCSNTDSTYTWSCYRWWYREANAKIRKRGEKHNK